MGIDEIKVKEYVRTDDGLLFKADEYWYYECLPKLDENVRNRLKAKPNIIDLIEVGDIVEYILHTALEDLHCIAIVEDEHFLKALKTNKDFKLLSVTTKEQFENIKYKVGD